MTKIAIPSWVDEIEVKGPLIHSTKLNGLPAKHGMAAYESFLSTIKDIPDYIYKIIQLPPEVDNETRFVNDLLYIVTIDNKPYNQLILKQLLKEN